MYIRGRHSSLSLMIRVYDKRVLGPVCVSCIYHCYSPLVMLGSVLSKVPSGSEATIHPIKVPLF